MGFSPFAEIFDGRNRGLGTALGWSRLRSLDGTLRPNSTGGAYYDPNQPRVPVGRRDGGQWTRVGSSETRTAQNRQLDRFSLSPVRLAAREPRGRRGLGLIPILLELLAQPWEHKEANAPPDLFGNRKELEDGTVAATIMDGKSIVGMNRNYRSYTIAHEAAAKRARDIVVKKHSDALPIGNIGHIPNNAFFFMQRRPCCCEQLKQTVTP